ncbi:MAG: 16S rRNA (cytidine(1402)-2'-O)-methyltransferase [Chloroflexota bacterium]
MSTLYLVATPIGNLEDISARALRLLREVRLIAAEDTRQTRKLLNHFGIRTPLCSYHEHNKLTRLDAVLAALAEGDVALVSDAGTPALNDPGYELTQAVLAVGHTVSPVPGPSAPVAALVASGLPTDSFLYLGYLPRKPSERQAFLKPVAHLPYTLIFLETPHRLLGALDDLRLVLGERAMAAARELTKLHEEIVRGPIGAVQDHFKNNPPRGEFTLVVAGAESVEAGRWPEDRLQAALQARLQSGEPASQIAATLAHEAGWPKKEVYRLLHTLKPSNSTHQEFS